MPIRRTQIARRAALASCVALAALSASAFAKDLPPSPDSAAKLQAFFATYLGKQAPATITPADPGFWVAFDLAALTAPIKTAGFAFDPATLKYHVVEQDDGAVAGGAFETSRPWSPTSTRKKAAKRSTRRRRSQSAAPRDRL